MTEADYIVVGAGSAGCAIAYRLAEAGRKVLVIEHGGTDAGPFIRMPAALSYPMNMARYDWGYVTEPEPHMGGRRMACPRGKVIGGSSSINGMIYVRGHAHDYDTGPRWAPTAGPTPTCCPISGGWSIGTGPEATRPGAAPTGRFTSRVESRKTLCSKPLSKPARRRATA
jgi:choline dehydrogenase-like flavoprotein